MQVSAPALDAFGEADHGWPARSTWSSSTPSSTEYSGLPRRAHRRRPAGRWRARRRRQRAVERPRVGAGRRPTGADDRATPALRAFCAPGRGRSALHDVDPAARRRAPRGRLARAAPGEDPRPPVRDPARAGRHPRGPARPGRRRPRSPTPGPRSSALHPVLAPGRDSVRFARNGAYADPATDLADGDELAVIPPVSGGADGQAAAPPRSVEIREHAVARRRSSASSSTAWRSEDGAAVGFLGRTRSTPGTPAPGQEAEAARHAGRSVESLTYEAHESMAMAVLGDHRRRDRRRASAWSGLAIVHRTGEVPLGDVSIAVVAAGRPSRGGLRRRPLRHRRDQGPGPDLEGRAVPRRPRLDRPSGPHRPRRARSSDRPMRVYISVDMEGIGGINHPHPTDPKDTRYATSVALMVGETNAAIEGALAAGATDILVNDSHWNMYNLLPEDLHRSARVLQGEKAWSMVAGAQPPPDGSPAFDVALFVGYHARAGHGRGHDRPHLQRSPDRDAPGRPADRRVRAQRPGPRGLGHPGRDGHRRRRPGRGGRRLAAVGRAGRGQGRRRHAQRDQRRTRRSRASASGPRRRRPSGAPALGSLPAARGRAAGRHRGRLRPRRRAPTHGADRARCRAGRRPDRPLRQRRPGRSPTAGSWPSTGWPVRSTDGRTDAILRA